jgi:hypothetical protein
MPSFFPIATIVWPSAFVAPFMLFSAVSWAGARGTSPPARNIGASAAALGAIMPGGHQFTVGAARRQPI